MRKDDNTMSQERRDRFPDYRPVHERLAEFYAEHPQGRVITSIETLDIEAGHVLFKAELFRSPDDAQPAATGHAFETKESNSYINKTSLIENAETSAVGRALMNLGYETKKSAPTAQEEAERAGDAAARAERPARANGHATAPGALISIATIQGINKFPPAQQHLKLDRILDAPYEELGGKPERMTERINKEFQVDDGLNSLSLDTKKDLAMKWINERNSRKGAATK
jgi:hypothetical protein